MYILKSTFPTGKVLLFLNHSEKLFINKRSIILNRLSVLVNFVVTFLMLFNSSK